MSPEIVISALTRLNELLNARYEEQKKKVKKFRQLQLMLLLLSFSVCVLLFVFYSPSLVQMAFILIGFNLLFFIGFTPRSFYSKKNIDVFALRISDLQSRLKLLLSGEETSFEGSRCSLEQGWTFDKWGMHKEGKRVDYAVFLYDKHIKGLYLEALKNKK
jgi:hypothetical protein